MTTERRPVADLPPELGEALVRWALRAARRVDVAELLRARKRRDSPEAPRYDAVPTTHTQNGQPRS